MSSPRQKATEHVKEIENELNNGTLSAKQRHDLEIEFGAIADNMSEAVYSNDPDDCVNWSDCPGIYKASSTNNMNIIKFFCPVRISPVNDRTSYADPLPYIEEIVKVIEEYNHKFYDNYLAEVIDEEWLYGKVLAISTPEVQVCNGDLYGVIETKVYDGFSERDTEVLRKYLNGQMSNGWGFGLEKEKAMLSEVSMQIRFWTGDNEYFMDTEFEFKQRMADYISQEDIPDMTV